MPIHPNHIRLKTVTLSGTEVEVYVSPDTGRFYLYDPDGNALDNDKDMEAAIGGSRGILRRRKITVDIPFRTPDGKRGSALSIHSGSKNVTIKMSGEPRKRQIDEYDARRGYYRADTPEEAFSEIARLRALVNRHTASLRSLEDEWSIDLNAAVKDAIRAKVEAEDEAAWKVGAAGLPVTQPIPPADDEDEEEEDDLADGDLF